MRYQELFESKRVVTKITPGLVGWVNIKTKQFLGWNYRVSMSHVEFALSHSEFFKLPTEFQTISSSEYDGNFKILNYMYKNHWIRIIHKSYEDNSTNIQAKTLEQVVQASRIINNFDHIEYLYFELDDRHLGEDRHHDLEGRQLQIFLKTGNLSKSRLEISESRKLNNDELQLFANQTESELGLRVFSLYMVHDDIKLISIIINKEDRKKGLGSEAMDRLTKFADQNGKRIILSPASKDDYHGTTSRSRLIKFYKRFGFYENKGKDFSISETMIRDPNLMERLNEKVEMVNRTKVLINPSVMALRNFIGRTTHKTGRGLFDGMKFYFWDAADIIHDHMAANLGIEFYARLTVKGNNDETFDIYADPRKDFNIGMENDYEDEFDTSEYDLPETDTLQVEDHPYYLKLRREG